MKICDFDGTIIDITEEEVERMLHGFSPVDTCRFHLEMGGVACDAKTRKPGQCERCGWNPAVARRRSYLIREKRKDSLNATD